MYWKGWEGVEKEAKEGKHIKQVSLSRKLAWVGRVRDLTKKGISERKSGKVTEPWGEN